MKFPQKKYDLIVVDPPWPIKKITRKKRPNQTQMDYPLMDFEEIKSLPVGEIAKDECIVFLWTIQKFLFKSKEVIESWGFKHLVTMVWEKTYGKSAGMPLYGFRWNAEFILVGYNKKPELWPKRKLIPLVFQAENVKHSQKPDLFYKMIEPLGKERIDLFARKNRENWDALGFDIDGKDIKESINLLAQKVSL